MFGLSTCKWDILSQESNVLGKKATLFGPDLSATNCHKKLIRSQSPDHIRSGVEMKHVKSYWCTPESHIVF